MQFDIAGIVMAGTTVVSLAASAVCLLQTFTLRKRLAHLQELPVSLEGESLADYQAIASRITALQNSISILQSGFAEVQNSVTEMDGRSEEKGRAAAAAASVAGSVESPRTARAGGDLHVAAPINLNRRGQMLRMHRRGESVSAIASALGISQGEVKLTVRMQELYSEVPEKENSQDRL